MGDLVKWGILAAVVVSALLLIVSVLSGYALDFLTGVWLDNEGVRLAGAAIDSVTGYIVSAREILNNFVYPPALTVIIASSLFTWAAELAIKTVVLIVKFIYK